MAEQDTLKSIAKAIQASKSFVVEAGAGSGKTRSLIDTIRSQLLLLRDSYEATNKRLVCITFTNVAKDEISNRLNQDDLVLVDTIHEFLWRVISPFQAELKIEAIAQNALDNKGKIDNLEAILGSISITYGQFGRHFDRGELFHDDVLSFAASLFEKYPKIVRLAADQYPLIFVDEYQDTSPHVIGLLLDHFVQHPRKPVVGFFGDEMQQIYESGTVALAGRADLVKITKTENYRCSVKVIDVLNRLRSDLKQVPSGDNDPGNVHLFQSAGTNVRASERVIGSLSREGWTPENTKVVMLTHKGIARENGYLELMQAYGKKSFGNDRLLQRDDEFGEIFLLVEGLASSYEAGDYGKFLDLLGKNGLRIRSHTDKKAIADEMGGLNKVRADGTVLDVVQFIAASKLIPEPRSIRQLIASMAGDPASDDEKLSKARVFYNAVTVVPYEQVSVFTEFVEAHTPYSTQHGVKGAEFPNVLVVVDDSLWNRYKYGGVFVGSDTRADRLARSRRLLYVSFSRARKGLAVLYLGSPASLELDGAMKMLGVQKASSIDT